MKLPDSITELHAWPNGSLIPFLERLKNAVSTYQEDDLIEEVILRLKRQDTQQEELAALIRDKQRLDWLQSASFVKYPETDRFRNIANLYIAGAWQVDIRYAVDSAMNSGT